MPCGTRWRPKLAKRFTVVCPDLRGYGGSLKPEATADHAPYAKKEMARDMVEVMEHFGHRRFLVGSHDRGARVAHRLAIDFPERVEKLAVLDIVPTIEHFERADMAFALAYYHWFWFAQPHPFPEFLINAAPEAWFTKHTSREPKPSTFFHPDALADYLAARAQPRDDPRHVRGLPRRRQHRPGARPRQPRRRRQGAMPAAWCCGAPRARSASGTTRSAIWRQYCSGPVTGGAVDSGHYLAEEAPGAVTTQLLAFFASSAPL